MSANVQGIIALTGRAHCQRQVAFLYNTIIRAAQTVLTWRGLDTVCVHWTVSSEPGISIAALYPIGRVSDDAMWVIPVVLISYRAAAFPTCYKLICKHVTFITASFWEVSIEICFLSIGAKCFTFKLVVIWATIFFRGHTTFLYTGTLRVFIRYMPR